jgi:hypothetical protein
MPSHLNRLVFRRLLADQPLFSRACLYRLPRPRPRLVPSHGRLQPLLAAPRRSFFELFKTRRKIKPAEMTPGLNVLSELAHRQSGNLRSPPPADIAKAMPELLAHRRTQLDHFHVRIVQIAFDYLLQHPPKDGHTWFSAPQLLQMMDRIVPRKSHVATPNLELGRMFDAELKRILHPHQKDDALGEYETVAIPKLIRLFTRCGASLEARNTVVHVYASFLDAPTQLDRELQATIHLCWASVLRGLADEDNEAELLATLDMMQNLSVPYAPDMQETVVRYFCEKKDLQQAEKWYLQPLVSADGAHSSHPMGATLAHILKACALYGNHALGQQIVASLLKAMPHKEAWDAVFLWSAAIGKGADEIDRMMNVMIRRNSEERQKNPSVPVIHPDIDTINTLVEFSMSRQDSYSAERYVTLGEKRGIFPNERTFTMQIQYRLSIGDIDGARAAYFGLQGDMSRDEQSVAAVNSLIQIMCQSQQQHFDDIMAIVDDLHERKARLEPETVATLCVLHFGRGEAHDAVDLLQMHAHSFAPVQRTIIRKKLAAFIMDGQTSTAEAWDAYQIMRNCFPETPRSDRIPIMNEFFARKRSDMACHVFFHMRNAEHESIAATKEVYIAAFTGFAHNADAESLELAHNQLKLDLNVEPDTRLRNALMLAYASTDNNQRALDFWAEIGASKEGPTYNSIAIAFRSCEGMPFGDQHAKSIWRRLKEMDIEIDKKLFTAYMGAIARNQLYDEALALVESAEEEYGFTPDLYM